MIRRWCQNLEEEIEEEDEKDRKRFTCWFIGFSFFQFISIFEGFHSLDRLELVLPQQQEEERDRKRSVYSSFDVTGFGLIVLLCEEKGVHCISNSK